MASNTDLDELLDGALDDFRDQPSLTDSGEPAAPVSPSATGGDSAQSAAGSSFRFDPLGKASPKSSPQSKGAKGPSLPPRPQARSKGSAAPPGLQEQAAHRQQPAHTAGSTGDASSSGMPDLAATLQALAMSGPDSWASGSGNAPDLEATLRAAAAATAADASGAASGPETDALFKELGDHLEGLGGDATDPEEFNAFVGGIMKQLLSKQVLHQSMKDIGDRYPQWLAKHADSLSDEDLNRYTRQHQHILEMCRLYDEDPDNFSAIYDCLQQMQACGTPPEEIVQELSPGLQFDADGLPQLPTGAPPGCCIQ